MARESRDEVHNYDSFVMVDVAMAMRRLTSLKLLLLLAMVRAAKVCEVVGRCDRLCSDEC